MIFSSAFMSVCSSEEEVEPKRLRDLPVEFVPAGQAKGHPL